VPLVISVLVIAVGGAWRVARRRMSIATAYQLVDKRYWIQGCTKGSAEGEGAQP
jgi:hypothetical protein